jgi:hypothetical protein
MVNLQQAFLWKVRQFCVTRAGRRRFGIGAREVAPSELTPVPFDVTSFFLFALNCISRLFIAIIVMTGKVVGLTVYLRDTMKDGRMHIKKAMSGRKVLAEKAGTAHSRVSS